MSHTALITGGTAGIGYGIAEVFAKQGIDLVLSYHHDTERAKRAEDALSFYGIKVITIKADSGVLGDLQSLFQIANRDMGVIDILVNNIGSTFPDDRDTNTERESMFHYHLMGTVSSTQLFQQQLGNQKGCIINISSVSGIEPLLRYKGATLEAYCCMKAAVNMYTKIIANQCAGTIRVNSIAPGNTDTESWKGSDEGFKELRRKGTLIGRFIKPSEIGKMAYQIIENEALNGQVFIVDGGVVGKGYEQI